MELLALSAGALALLFVPRLRKAAATVAAADHWTGRTAEDDLDAADAARAKD